MKEDEKPYLGIVPKSLKSGDEQLHFERKPLGPTLLDYWRWSASDLISNATRGVLAEFIIATAMNIDIKTQVRDEWSAYDLTSPEGIKIEVKSSSYMQSWNQNRESNISFSIKRSQSWDPESNRHAIEKKIQADVYAFCLLKPRTKTGLDPLNLGQWGFYVLSADEIENYTRSKHSITLKSLQKLAVEVRYNRIRETVTQKFHA